MLIRIIAALLGAAIFFGAGAGAVAQTPRVVPESRADVQFSFAPLVRKVAPAVVNVNTRRAQRTGNSPLFNDPFFRRFFGDQAPNERALSSLGSGVIVDPSGVIVSNNHVIRGADEITVVLADRREFEARVVLSDERTDLAVLRIDTKGERLPALEFRDSDDVEVGDLVLAIGNPFGVGQTVTSGIVSALARTVVGISDLRFFIQTDAAINPGNSGGALVATDGRLIGINTAIFSRDGANIGIGFAIPSNMVRAVVAGANSAGKLVRPWLGAHGQTVTADLAASLGLARPVGVLVSEAASGSPAERAGIRRGDVITHVEGREVADAEALRFRVATMTVGGKMRLSVFRDGRTREVQAELMAPPEQPPRNVTPLRGNHALSGATVANLSPALAEELGFDGPARGVIVLEVRRASSALQIRMAPGDVIQRINDREIRVVEDLQRAVTQIRLPWRLTFLRGDRVVNITVAG